MENGGRLSDRVIGYARTHPLYVGGAVLAIVVTAWFVRSRGAQDANRDAQAAAPSAIDTTAPGYPGAIVSKPVIINQPVSPENPPVDIGTPPVKDPGGPVYGNGGLEKMPQIKIESPQDRVKRIKKNPGKPGDIVDQIGLPFRCRVGHILTWEKTRSGNLVCQKPNGVQYQVIYRDTKAT